MGANGAIVLPEAAANQDAISLDKGKPPTVETDDWLVALLSTLWHSRDQSAETRDIAESNVNPEGSRYRQPSLLGHASGPPE